MNGKVGRVGWPTLRIVWVGEVGSVISRSARSAQCFTGRRGRLSVLQVGKVGSVFYRSVRSVAIWLVGRVGWPNLTNHVNRLGWAGSGWVGLGWLVGSVGDRRSGRSVASEGR